MILCKNFSTQYAQYSLTVEALWNKHTFLETTMPRGRWDTWSDSSREGLGYRIHVTRKPPPWTRVSSKVQLPSSSSASPSESPDHHASTRSPLSLSLCASIARSVEYCSEVAILGR